MRRAIENTPFAPIFKSFRDDLLGKNGQRAQAQALAKWTLGSSIFAGAGAMSGNGNLTGSGPSDPAERAVLRSTGWQPNSIQLGNKYYSYI